MGQRFTRRNIVYAASAVLNWIIYNKPLEYADRILNGGIEEYCKSSHKRNSLENQADGMI